MNGTLPAPAWMLHWVPPSMASRSGESGLPLAISERTSIVSSVGAATMAGPVRKPCEMKSRRVTGRLWLSCLMGSFSPSPRGLFLSKYMLSSPLLEQRRTAAEYGAAGRFHDGTGTAAGTARGAGQQLGDEVVQFVVNLVVIRIPLETGVLALRKQVADQAFARARSRGAEHVARAGRGDAAREERGAQVRRIHHLRAVLDGQLRETGLLRRAEGAELLDRGQRLLHEVVGRHDARVGLRHAGDLRQGRVELVEGAQAHVRLGRQVGRGRRVRHVRRRVAVRLVADLL